MPDILKAANRMKYQVHVQKTEEGFSVSCPGLPGCWSQGATEEEALENIQSAIQEYVAAVRESINGLKLFGRWVTSC